MAHVLLLGGTGLYGRDVALLLAATPETSRLTIAGRDVAAAGALAEAAGPKARAAHLDLTQPDDLASLAAGADLVVNVAGPERLVVLPALRGAIAAGAGYCDLCADAAVTAEARRLDGAAKAAGVTAVLGAGELPGRSNLLMLRAARALDQPGEVRHCAVYAPSRDEEQPADTLERWRRSGRVDASWQLIIRSFAPPVTVVSDGRLTAVDPAHQPIGLTVPGGAQVTAHPVGFPEPLTLHEALPGVPSIAACWSFAPDELNGLALVLGRRIASGEFDEAQAAVSFMEHLATAPRAGAADEPPAHPAFVCWAEATGLKDGRRARASCAARGDWATTAALLCAAALRLLRGEVPLRGVLAPEACLDSPAYFAEAARLAGTPAAPVSLFQEDRLTLA